MCDRLRSRVGGRTDRLDIAVTNHPASTAEVFEPPRTPRFSKWSPVVVTVALMMWHLPQWAIVGGVLGGVAVALCFKSFRLVIRWRSWLLVPGGSSTWSC